MDKIAVLIPCYNESRTIEKVVTDFKRVLPEATIYVYDNNSTDGTDELARGAGATVRYEYRQGKGIIVLDGCEDKPDNDPRYYGMGDWNEYRRQQAEWLKGVVNSDEFRAAPVRIVLMHMIPGKEDSW